MQLGVFAAIPLVADREKLILKRLQATPLRRWQLVGSNVVMRLIIAVVQTAIIVGVGSAVFDVQVAGSWLLIGAFVLLGSLTFIALGYVIASFASSEESANGMTSVVQFPLMFLSGTFFPIDAMPDALQTVARAMPCARSWSAGYRSRRCGSASPCSSAGSSSVSASQPATSGGSSGRRVPQHSPIPAIRHPRWH